MRINPGHCWPSCCGGTPGARSRGPWWCPAARRGGRRSAEGVAGGYAVIVTTGGTGLTPMDLTPEMTARVISREIPGIAEAIRQADREKVPTSILSRGLAGQAGDTLIVNLPGSSGGVRDGV